jgi:hypothetical protein
MMRLLSLIAGAAGVLVVTGFPVHPAAAPPLLTVWHTVTRALGPAASVVTMSDQGAHWTECGSLLLLATGMFGAAVLLGRGRP